MLVDPGLRFAQLVICGFEQSLGVTILTVIWSVVSHHSHINIISSYFGAGGRRPRPVIEIPMATPPSAAAATQALVKAVTAAPPKGETLLSHVQYPIFMTGYTHYKVKVIGRK